jgi:hypothetical protein
LWRDATPSAAVGQTPSFALASGDEISFQICYRAA